MKKRTINILGTKYSILFGTEAQFPALKNADGYCDETIKCIVVDTFENCVDDVKAKKNMVEHQKKVIRHEIIHAFFFESGLSSESNDVNQWAMNEEMIDWIAYQLPKIITVCEEALAL